MKKSLLPGFLCIFISCNIYASNVVITPVEGDDASLIQNSMDALQKGDTLTLQGDFVIAKTIYLPSDFTWILDGTLTLSADADLDEAGWVSDEISAKRRTGITEKTGGATNIDMSGGTYYGNSANYTKSMRFLNFVSVTNSYFHDMTITEVTDDNFTLAPGSNHNECRNLIGSFSKSGNALTDKGEHNTWIDCIASNCGSDGWTPKCRYSTFIRCIAADNVGPGFGMYAREEGYADNRDVGAHIIGNNFIDCVSYGSLHSSGFSFNISSNCPEAIIKDNYIQAVCYDNQGSGVFFRNKDDAELGVIEDNVVDIVCYGNKGLRKGGDNSSWAGGLGMEDDNSSTHNIIENITGSVVCFNNRIDVNTRGGHSCNIIVYHPELAYDPILDDKSSHNNTISVSDFTCSDPLEEWCQTTYCDLFSVKLPGTPFELSANVLSSSRIDLNWEDTTELEDGFLLERKMSGEFNLIDTLEANSTIYCDTGLFAETEYTYRLRSFNELGFSAYSNDITATTNQVSDTTSRETITMKDNSLEIYPNPFYENAKITYTLYRKSFVSIKVFDSHGREVCNLVDEYKPAGNHAASFIGNDLPGGSYFLRYVNNSKSETKQLMLIR